MIKYPKIVTERFDDANFHISYCLYFIRKYLKGNILEVGAGCGSFTKHYLNKEINSITLTELDSTNISNLNSKFKTHPNIKIEKKKIDEINEQFDVIIYLHVLEHIKDDVNEIKEATKRLNKNGFLIFMVPAHQKIYSNLDKAVGHFRRYEIDFFKKNFESLEQIDIKFLDTLGFFLYYLNKFTFKNEVFPSKFKIFIWDKIFTPITILVDFLFRYKFGKCILAIYKKSS